MNEQFWWFLARSSGIVAWALLVASVALGLVLSTRALGKRPTPAWSLDIHRGVSGIAVLLTATHLGALVADTYVDFGLAALLVPMASSWRPLAVTWGVAALYLLIAVEVSSLLRTRIPLRVWRGIHMSSFVLYALATVHFVTAGTDVEGMPGTIAVIGSMVVVAALTLVRILAPRTQGRRQALGRRSGASPAARPAPGEVATTSSPAAAD